MSDIALSSLDHARERLKQQASSDLLAEIAELIRERDDLRHEVQRLTAGKRIIGAAPGDEFLTVDQAAVIAHCNPATIRRAFAKGSLQGFRPAHRILLKGEDVRAWIKSAPVTVQTASRPRQRRGRPVPSSVAALREMDPELSR